MKRSLPIFLALSIAPLAQAAPTKPVKTAVPAKAKTPPRPAPGKTIPAKPAAAKTTPAKSAEPIFVPAKPKAPAFDPAAALFLDQSSQAYAALKGLSMRFTAHDSEGDKTTGTSGLIAFARPDKVKLEFKVGGKEYLNVSSSEKIFTQSEPSTYYVNYAPDGNTLGTVLGRIPSALSLFLPALIAGNNPLGLEGIRWQAVRMLPDNGISLSADLRPDLPPLVFRLYFDPTDKLLRRVEADMVNEAGKKSINITTLSDLQIGPPLTTDFTFTPPAGAKEVVSVPAFDPALKVGTTPFELKGKDLSGKTVSWKGYKGKVVLLDFWATWCGPCVAELPNVLENYQIYHQAGFEILGVSLDEDKAALETFVKERKLPYPTLFDGAGWKNADATTYGIQAIPFSLLIGKDGKIAAVNPRGKQLEPAIVKALAG
jgi:thiol-disulfide isomerase/thioredoxin